MFNLPVPLNQLFLDVFNSRNNLNLTLADVILSEPTVSRSSRGNTNLTLTIPARGNSSTVVQYVRWDLKEFYDIHDPVYVVERKGIYTLQDVLALVNARLVMQLEASEFVDGQWDLVNDSVVVKLQAADSNVMLVGSIDLTLSVV
ncbi:hypothetical protein [Stenotrophomonas sp. GD03657]|uniref:DUF7941 domain-family protein n=1 Tax=Stenotrophomonas sp. GD03657 TaxID=2975363 RepID=UPI00244A759E|nr:hypothetical protein [Stenotrophomonas sp. GD03657]MDH2154203.1 hypothetical protein [Stenotrophomonas sp. GD03657]